MNSIADSGLIAPSDFSYFRQGAVIPVKTTNLLRYPINNSEKHIHIFRVVLRRLLQGMSPRATNLSLVNPGFLTDFIFTNYCKRNLYMLEFCLCYLNIGHSLYYCHCSPSPLAEYQRPPLTCSLWPPSLFF